MVNLTAQLGYPKKGRNFSRLRTLADPKITKFSTISIWRCVRHNLMHRDQDYVVKEDRVLIVDEFAGRIMREDAIRRASPGD